MRFALSLKKFEPDALRDKLGAFLKKAGVKDVHFVLLAVEEAVVNIFEHSPGSLEKGPVRITAAVSKGSLKIGITDSGPAVKLPKALDLDMKSYMARKRGLGLFMIKKFMDSMEYRRKKSGENVLVLTRSVGEKTGKPDGKKPLRCDEFRFILLNYLSESIVLSAGQLKRAASHRGSCPGCARYARETGQTIKLLHSYNGWQELVKKSDAKTNGSSSLLEFKPDEDLMKDYQQGDTRALDVIFRRYRKPGISFISKYIRDAAQAEEISQESFLRLYKSAQKYDPKRKFSTWYFQIVKNICLDHLKSRNGRMERNTRSIEDGLERAGGLADAVEAPARLRLLKEALKQLPENYIDIIILHEFQGVKYKEIARLTGCTENTAKVRMFIAVNKLRKLMFKGKDEN